jgi:SAM-dependent methyltransferase
MSHPQQREFFTQIKAKFPNRFKNCSVLDIGSLDINGNNRFLFEDCSYIGVDIGPGKNVDIISKGHEYDPVERFDVVISSECFEHDMHYADTIKNAIRLTKPNGMFLFTCASTGRPEHGTRRTSPNSSPYTSNTEGWMDYYKNLTEKDIREVIKVESVFTDHYFEYKNPPCDLYFWGIKK